MTDDRQRTGKVIDIASALGTFRLPEFDRLENPAFWRRRDAQVAKLRAEQQRAEAAKWREHRRKLMLATGAPRRAVEIALTGEGLDEYAPGMLAVATWRGGGLRVLSGGTGVGKTLAAVWWITWYGGPRPAFLTASELEAAGRYDRQTRAIWRDATSLVLDDLGAESVDGKGNFLSQLDEITNLYHGDKRALIMTVNITGDDFKERYGARIASRIRGDAGWCPLVGGDRRAEE